MATETTATDIDWRWRSELLGEPRVLDLPQGSLRCFVRGEGPTVVFAHGWLANANLWRAIVQQLAGNFTCVTLDLPLGGHTLALNADADLTPEGCGALSAEPVRRAGARLIESFEGPVLLAWPTEDRVFPYEHAERYATALPRARIEPIADAYSFTPEDQPERLAEILAAFAGSS
ncbi:MAG TPA: alpha/beta hydrolase [Solirubrobacteraceae bacterium]|jgi:pimeloyl-ACP methyl ester carboxylesterase